MTWHPKWDERCGPKRKVRYPSAAKARQWERRNRLHFGQQRVYHCTACDGWHLTSRLE